VFAGHAALALLVKAKRPRVPLALLVPVAFAPDCIELAADLLGHQNREISHSLMSVGIGATIVALAYWLATRAAGDAVAVWLTYVSHWPADYLTGLKPTWPGGPMVGRLLYTRPVLDAWLECALVVVCWLAYRQSLVVARRRARLMLVPAGLIALQLAFDVTRTLGKPSLIDAIGAALATAPRERARPSTLDARPCSIAACLLQGSPLDSTQSESWRMTEAPAVS
jgi:membrane-bound metal-dependent hydrolase YbcI (DUF457 family)